LGKIKILHLQKYSIAYDYDLTLIKILDSEKDAKWFDLKRFIDVKYDFYIHLFFIRTIL